MKAIIINNLFSNNDKLTLLNLVQNIAYTKKQRSVSGDINTHYSHTLALDKIKNSNILSKLIKLSYLEQEHYELFSGKISALGFGDQTSVHTDYKENTGITLICYVVDKNWKIEDGGQTFLLRDGDIVKSVTPLLGRVFCFDGSIEHIGMPPFSHKTRYAIVLKFKKRINL